MVSNTQQKQALLAIFLNAEKGIKIPKKIKKSVSHASFITELKKHSITPSITRHLKPFQKPLKNLLIKKALLQKFSNRQSTADLGSTKIRALTVLEDVDIQTLEEGGRII